MKLKLMSVALATTVALVGCGTTNDGGGNANKDGATDKNDTNVEQTRYNDDVNDNNRNNNTRLNNGKDRMNNDNNRMNTRDGDRNNDERYNVSKEAADKITAEVDEIDRAYVLTTKNNAYVGAVLNNHDNDGTKNNNRDNNNKNKNNNDGVTNHDGINNTGDLNRKNNDGARNMGTNRDGDQEVTDEVKKQITDAVKSVDNDIDKVHVTTNPDFIDLTNDYANEARNGHPIGGFFDQIGDMVKRVFPTGNR